MVNTGAQLGQVYQTTMPAFTDNADIQHAMMMLWYGDPNATSPTGKGVERYLSDLDTKVNGALAKKTTDVIFSSTAPTRNTIDYDDWFWVDTSKTNADGASRPINVWNGAAWSPVAGVADPAADYAWTGKQTFQQINVKGPINGYATESARSTDLAGAPNGTLSFVNGRYEYLNNGSWTPVGSSEKTIESRSATSTTMADSDSDKLLRFTAAGASQYIINANQVKVGASVHVVRIASTPLTIVAGPNVVLQAKNPVLGQYASTTLTKTGTNTWVMQGTGTAIPPGGTGNQALLKVDGSDYNTSWVSVVPASGGSFTGQVNMTKVSINELSATDIGVPSGSLKVGGKRVFVQPTQPAGMVAGDVWIQT